MKRCLFFFLIAISSACREEIRVPYITGMENKPILKFDILLPDSTTYFNTSKLETDKQIILFYYSPACPYCRAQMRDMVSHINQLKNVQLCVVTSGDFRSMKDFNSHFDIGKYPKIITGVDTGHVIARNYRVQSVPFTALFNNKQQLIGAYVGRLSNKSMREILGI